MKKILVSLFLLGMSVVLFNNCNKDKEEAAPQLPPYESMAIDLSKFSGNDKTAASIDESNTYVNYTLSAVTVGYWNLVLTVTLVVPVASFYQAFSQTAKYLGNKTWQWEYDGTGLASTYHARLTGTIRAEDIKWEMYISKSGVGAFNEFLWFEGTSALDGNSGQWILYQSYLVQEAVLQIDWSKTGNEIGSVKYSYIRESDNGDVNQLTNGSYLQYGLTDDILNAFYTIVYNTRNSSESDKSVFIEWSTSEYNGRIKAEHYFSDANWHCWDSTGADVVCE